MKRFLLITVILLIAGLAFFGYNYAGTHLESIASKFLADNFKIKISIGHVGIRLPLCLELKDVEIDDLVDIKSVRIYPSPTSFLLKDKAVFSSAKILGPVVRIKKGDIKDLGIAGFLKANKKQLVSADSKAPKFYLSRIRIEKGTVIYGEGKDALEFVNIKGNIRTTGSSLLKDGISQFAVAGFLKNKDSDFLSPLKIDGFLEPDGIIKARLEASDLNMNSLGAVYNKYLSSLLESAKIGFKSDIEISKKRMIAKCVVKGEDIVLKNRSKQEIEAPMVASFTLLVNFRNNLVKIKRLRGNFLKFILGRR